MDGLGLEPLFGLSLGLSPCLAPSQPNVWLRPWLRLNSLVRSVAMEWGCPSVKHSTSTERGGLYSPANGYFGSGTRGVWMMVLISSASFRIGWPRSHVIK